MPLPLPRLAVAAALALAACTPKPSDRSCPSGQERCNGGCVDPATYATDPASCGGCGNVCATGASCVSGVCVCPNGQQDCAGRCVDPSADGANCGGCGIACGLGTCAGGTCQCDPSTTACTSTVPRCVDGLNDPRNCGLEQAACGNRCPLANEICDLGTCACPTGTIRCPAASPTACVDPASDEANCGGCGIVCATGQTCTSGVCLCPTGQSVCDGACVDRSTDEVNCGACGWTCAVGATCGGGSCACPSGRTTPCGQGATGGGTCCAGNTCCSGACQTEHDNGLGQHFYDCLALGTYDVTQARAAAAAWQASGAVEIPGYALGCASPSCIGWQTQTSCGVWCYGGTADPLRGRASVVQSIACVGACPTAGAPNWN
jgi:hypothetical protein